MLSAHECTDRTSSPQHERSATEQHSNSTVSPAAVCPPDVHRELSLVARGPSRTQDWEESTEADTTARMRARVLSTTSSNSACGSDSATMAPPAPMLMDPEQSINQLISVYDEVE